MDPDVRGTWRSSLDLLATVLVILGSLCVIGLAASKWLEGGLPPRPQQAVNASVKHPLTGAQLLGNRNAKVALIQYIDFECSFCAEFARDVWPAFKERYVDTGRVLVAVRHLPLPSHRHAKAAAISAVCAGKQNRFWQMHDRLFQSQSTLDQSTGNSLARELSLNLHEFAECSRDATGEVERDAALTKAFGIKATPTFALGRVNADHTVGDPSVLVGNQSIASIAAVADALLGSTP